MLNWCSYVIIIVGVRFLRWHNRCLDYGIHCSNCAKQQPGPLSETSASETIRKRPLAEAQTALGKQKIRPIAEIVKNCFPMQNFTKIGESPAELWPKTIFNMAAVRHLEF